jgi:hypothetical protein
MTDFSKELTFNVGRVSGGTVLNRVPMRQWPKVISGLQPTFQNDAKARLLALAGKGDVRSRADG